MSSIIDGYNYDIFISYRQKDNKHDGWVTDFVNNLQGELESTFKEEISVYFDINPHDGLLETYDVDASLKDKLKCLVFIPILSRTYCDPKSFAWEHEFKAFVEQAGNDRFGLKVKLPNGNVAPRVLPVKIHDLDPSDIQLCESILGGLLRGIDFIFKSSGVNRPLRMNEDNPRDNLNRTYYRDQINKVANAINDIIHGIKHGELPAREMMINENKKSKQTGKRDESGFIKMFRPRRLKGPLILFAILACLISIVIFLTNVRQHRSGKTIAILPLTIIGDNDLLSDGSSFVEVVNDKLRTIKKLSVVPSISMLQYRYTQKPPEVIKKETNADYFIYGNVRKEENQVIIRIELSNVNKILWTNKYSWVKETIPQNTREIVKIIASQLKIELSPEELRQIDTDPTKNPDANLNYISANVIANEGRFYYSYANDPKDSTIFLSAIKSYDKAIEFDSLFAQAYAKRSIAASWGYYTGQLDSSYIKKCKADIDKALSIEKDLTDAEIALGFYYYYCKNDYENALIHFKIASEKNQFDYQPLFYMSLVYRRKGDWKSTRSLLSKVVLFNPREPLFLTNIGLSYQYLHKLDSALLYHQKAIDMMPGWSGPYINKIQALMMQGKITEARKVVDAVLVQVGDSLNEYRIVLDIYRKNYSEALQKTLNLKTGDFYTKGTRNLLLATIYKCLNNPELVRLNYDSAQVYLEKKLPNNRSDYFTHASAGIAYAGLGNKVKAIEEGEKAIQLSMNNGMVLSDMRINMAQIYTIIGDYGRAITGIEYLLTNPSQLSVQLLKTDPVWKPLMDVKEFKKILKKHSE